MRKIIIGGAAVSLGLATALASSSFAASGAGKPTAFSEVLCGISTDLGATASPDGNSNEERFGPLTFAVKEQPAGTATSTPARSAALSTGNTSSPARRDRAASTATSRTGTSMAATRARRATARSTTRAARRLTARRPSARSATSTPTAALRPATTRGGTTERSFSSRAVRPTAAAMWAARCTASRPTSTVRSTS